MMRAILLLSILLLAVAAGPAPEPEVPEGYRLGTRDGVPVLVTVQEGSTLFTIEARDCDRDGQWSWWIHGEGWEFDSVYKFRVMPPWEVCEGYRERGSAPAAVPASTPAPTPTPMMPMDGGD